MVSISSYNSLRPPNPPGALDVQRVFAHLARSSLTGWYDSSFAEGKPAQTRVSAVPEKLANENRKTAFNLIRECHVQRYVKKVD